MLTVGRQHKWIGWHLHFAHRANALARPGEARQHESLFVLLEGRKQRIKALPGVVFGKLHRFDALELFANLFRAEFKRKMAKGVNKK